VATLPDICPSRAQKTINPRTLQSDFGDGYTQRAQDGLNNRLRVYQVAWERYPLADIVTLETFLESQEGYIAFDWTPPNGTAGKWIARTWTRSDRTYNIATLTSRFEEVADL
jgi:phage-related protein